VACEMVRGNINCNRIYLCEFCGTCDTVRGIENCNVIQ
jgi:hypothetical protein